MSQDRSVSPSITNDGGNTPENPKQDADSVSDGTNQPNKVVIDIQNLSFSYYHLSLNITFHRQGLHSYERRQYPPHNR